MTVTPEGAWASPYRHPAHGVLVVGSNLGRQEAHVKVRLDQARLGLSGAVRVQDPLTGEALSLVGDSLALPLDSLEWRLVWVQGEEERIRKGG